MRETISVLGLLWVLFCGFGLLRDLVTGDIGYYGANALGWGVLAIPGIVAWRSGRMREVISILGLLLALFSGFGFLITLPALVTGNIGYYSAEVLALGVLLGILAWRWGKKRKA